MKTNPADEIKLLPVLIRAAGWSCSEVHTRGDLIVGASDKTPHDDGGIRVFTGVSFNVSIVNGEMDDMYTGEKYTELKVRLSWPGHGTTTRVNTADQVMFWLGKLMPVAVEDYNKSVEAIRSRIVKKKAEQFPKSQT